ncbi:MULTISPECIES: DMT family transporter [Sphingobacterium]|uniref:EamA family transporter n=1 Tax=Sphingobacterium athyrii TaxID=2152717 RepID=A0A363NYW4_9SPHI|nr:MULTISPECIES: DMT family transporter [Sphingobacterium]PUV25861.1 EamA family transporter [Sphingobacterium athyrii]QIH33262.1 DMT family transporter [Sphingobacterium sp. DR205]
MKHSYFILHLAVVCLGISGVLGKVISLNEGMLTWYRVFFAAIFLFFILKWFKIPHQISLAEKLAIAKNGLLVTASWLLFYASIKYSNISIGVVCYCMASFFTAIFAPMINRTRFKRSEFLLSGLTLCGIASIFHFDTAHQLGIILGIISPAFASLYAIYNERLVKRYNSIIINYYQMIGGTIGLGLLLPGYLYYYPMSSFIPSLTDMLYLLILSLFCTVAVYIAFTEILKRISAFTLNLSLNLEPVYAILIAFFFFHESKELNLSFYFGLSLVMLSVFIQALLGRKRE